MSSNDVLFPYPGSLLPLPSSSPACSILLCHGQPMNACAMSLFRLSSCLLTVILILSFLDPSFFLNERVSPFLPPFLLSACLPSFSPSDCPTALSTCLLHLDCPQTAQTLARASDSALAFFGTGMLVNLFYPACTMCDCFRLPPFSSCGCINLLIAFSLNNPPILNRERDHNTSQQASFGRSPPHICSSSCNMF